MDVYAVAGESGVGTTTTALNLAVALRGAGAYAAVLDADLDGNVCSALGIDPEATLGEVLAGEADVADAVVEHPLSTENVPESDLASFWAAVGNGQTGFRAGGSADRPGSDAEEFDVDTVPVVAGFRTRTDHTGTDADALSEALSGLTMAYDVLVVDTGNGRSTDSPTVDVADGAITVTTPDPTNPEAARSIARTLAGDGTPVLGVVANRAGENTSIDELTDTAGTTALGVVPEDARGPAVEPVAFTTAGSPSAGAYERLATSVLGWDGSSGYDGSPPDDAGVAADGEGGDGPTTHWRGRPVGGGEETDTSSDDEDSDGFLSGLFGGD
jgi:MinD-like ATPase involved in chromosome partitioning or flagellar assembly